MASWRTLLTPNTEKNIGSLIFNENSRFLNDDSQIREIKPSNSKNMMIVSKIVNEARKEDANKNLNYQQKLELLQKEIVALKKQNKENNDPNSKCDNLVEIRSTRHQEIREASQEIRSFHMNSEVKIFTKKGRKSSMHEESFIVNGTRIKKKGSPSFMNFADLGLNLKNEISDHSAITEISQNQCPSEFSEQRSLESDCSVNLIKLVHKYQKSLKKEKKKTQALNRKILSLQKENSALKRTLKENNLWEEFKEKEKENKNHLQKMQDILFKKKEPDNLEVSNITENKTLLDKNEETIKDLMATKTDLVSALEQILSMFTAKSQKESFCSSKKEKIEVVLKDYEKSKRLFLQKKELIREKYANSEIFNSNERRKIRGNEFLSPTYMEKTNNLNYTPSNEDGVRSFFSNLKSSKAPK